MTTWKTKDGAVLNISDMETSHIQNCINMLDRSLNEYNQLHPEDQEDWNNQIKWAEINSKRDELEAELNNRKSKE